jgi:aspartyl-tRNA(Asn)/glutamyl-tRNA(Gln) amidotransferase subunit B
MHLNAKIGLEIHVQLNTKSKLFCTCSTSLTRPNSHVCDVCLGMPGSKPVLNKKAVDFSVMLALALNCNVPKISRFDRKTYFYPDLPKNYQITQYNFPIAQKGYLQILNNKIRIRRIQIEEDPGAITYPHHIDVSKYSLIDYNRSGFPLCEVVTEPDFSSSKEVKKFLKMFISMIKHLGIYSSNNSFRVDTNVSIGRNPRVEIKNIGSIKDVVSAIECEIYRQKFVLESGKKITQQTRRFTGSTTEAMREKETEEEYGYIIDPDLPPIVLTALQINQIKKKLPELPYQRAKRMFNQYKINKHQALAIVSEKELADFYENVVKHIEPKFAAGWISTQLLKVLNYNNICFSEIKLTSQHFISFLKLIQSKEISDRAADLLLRELVLKPQNPKKLAEKLNLLNLTEDELFKLIKTVLKKNKNSVDQYKKGKTKVLAFLIGQVIRESKGRADAKRVKELITKKSFLY